MADINMTLGAKAARRGEVSVTLTAVLKVTRGYIWLMKLRYIWAIIRADVKHG